MFSIQRNTMAIRRNNSNTPPSSSQEEANSRNTSEDSKGNFWDRLNVSSTVIYTFLGIIVLAFGIGYQYASDKKEREFKIKILEIDYEYKKKFDEEVKQMQNRGLSRLTDEEYEFFYNNYIKNKNGKK